MRQRGETGAQCECGVRRWGATYGKCEALNSEIAKKTTTANDDTLMEVRQRHTHAHADSEEIAMEIAAILSVIGNLANRISRRRRGRSATSHPLGWLRLWGMRSRDYSTGIMQKVDCDLGPVSRKYFSLCTLQLCKYTCHMKLCIIIINVFLLFGAFSELAHIHI